MGQAQKERHSSSGRKHSLKHALTFAESPSARPSVGMHWRQPRGPAVRLVTWMSDALVHWPNLKVVPGDLSSQA